MFGQVRCSASIYIFSNVHHLCREMFGQYPLACFDSILQKISSQTQAAALKGKQPAVLFKMK